VAESQHRQLAERRKALGYTQESFAELLRLDRTTVVRWESGKTLPRPGHRRHLARALGLTIDELQTSWRTLRRSAPLSRKSSSWGPRSWKIRRPYSNA
jgi:transcriptional regulator with XRE-family HTH domain